MSPAPDNFAEVSRKLAVRVEPGSEYPLSNQDLRHRLSGIIMRSLYERFNADAQAP